MIQVIAKPDEYYLYPPGIYAMTYEYKSSSKAYTQEIAIEDYYTKKDITSALRKEIENFDFVVKLKGPEPMLPSAVEKIKREEQRQARRVFA